MFFRRSRVKRQANDSRLHLVMAVIFLLGGLIIFRLYILQVSSYDLYTALADDQHRVFNKLKPKRGKIFIQDGRALLGKKLYPLAVNKEFALVYAVPSMIRDPDAVAEKLYGIFDADEVARQVGELLDNDEYFSILNGENNLAGKEKRKREEFRTIKREAEIKTRKVKIIENYVKKLSKRHDPYEPLRQKVSREELSRINELNIGGLGHIMQIDRWYPEGNIGAHILGFVGYSGRERRGLYGLEGFFNEELSGQFGFISTERSADGSLIIINDRQYNKPKNGSNLILTINRSIQFTACRKLNETASRHGADGGSIIVMEPNSGAILAMCSWPDYDPNNYSEVENVNVYNNPAIFSDYEPGSIFKVITMAASIDRGGVNPETTYKDGGFVKIQGWPKPIKNSDFDTHGAYGTVNMVTVLEKSLNTGAIFAMQRIGMKSFADYVKRFGFGEKTGIELETESAGNIVSLKRKRIRPVEAATASFGQGITVTPLQMVSAYAAVANGGILMKPYLVGEIVSPDGRRQITQPKQIRRVISERTAVLLSAMLVKVVDSGHAKKAAVRGYYVAGKTGTAQVADPVKRGYSEKTIHTFIGFAPVDEPKFVMLVKLDDPKDVRFAASSAAPLFGEIAEFILDYYQVPQER